MAEGPRLKWIWFFRPHFPTSKFRTFSDLKFRTFSEMSSFPWHFPTNKFRTFSILPIFLGKNLTFSTFLGHFPPSIFGHFPAYFFGHFPTLNFGQIHVALHRGAARPSTQLAAVVTARPLHRGVPRSNAPGLAGSSGLRMSVSPTPSPWMAKDGTENACTEKRTHD